MDKRATHPAGGVGIPCASEHEAVSAGFPPTDPERPKTSAPACRAARPPCYWRKAENLPCTTVSGVPGRPCRVAPPPSGVIPATTQPGATATIPQARAAPRVPQPGAAGLQRTGASHEPGAMSRHRGHVSTINYLNSLRVLCGSASQPLSEQSLWPSVVRGDHAAG